MIQIQGVPDLHRPAGREALYLDRSGYRLLKMASQAAYSPFELTPTPTPTTPTQAATPFAVGRLKARLRRRAAASASLHTAPPLSFPSPVGGDRARATHALPAPKWPKLVPPLTPEQRDQQRLHAALAPVAAAPHFSVVERFNHGYPVRHAPARLQDHAGDRRRPGRALGPRAAHARAGVPLPHAGAAREHEPRDLRTFPARRAPSPATASSGSTNSPTATSTASWRSTSSSTCPTSPRQFARRSRLCNKERGVFTVLIPCEGSPAYTLAPGAFPPSASSSAATTSPTIGSSAASTSTGRARS